MIAGIANWSGDWRGALRARLRTLGFDSLRDFLEDGPGVPYVQVAKRLGDEFAAAMIVGVQSAEAQASGEWRWFAMDALARIANDRLRRGWGEGRHFESNLAGVWAEWSYTIAGTDRDSEKLDLLRKAWSTLTHLPIPTAWMPTGPDDPILRAVFSEAWEGPPPTN